MADSPEAVKKHLPIYWGVFIALLVFTGITVGAANAHLQPYAWALTVGLIIAIVKGGLVGGFFMHLVGEKKIIFWLLILTFVLFIPLIALPILTTSDSPYEPLTQGSVYEHHEDDADHGDTHDDHAEEADAH